MRARSPFFLAIPALALLTLALLPVLHSVQLGVGEVERLTYSRPVEYELLSDGARRVYVKDVVASPGASSITVSFTLANAGTRDREATVYVYARDDSGNTLAQGTTTVIVPRGGTATGSVTLNAELHKVATVRVQVSAS